ncbi:hypothetical protein [Aeromicrobium sp.]|uniref:hypothetical protein n=1 Tax=Aeromicrobium sp. TaxID=1871063 RepID=UPI0019968C63|nr:hypothetical protein [Aeromicrobium sp.]MBC7630198.1 hypothetical protein [Aeromicrobium sp.]
MSKPPRAIAGSPIVRSLPAAVVIVAMVVVAHRGGVSYGDIGLYAVRIIVAVLLPGVLLSRLVRSGRRTGIDDLAVGFAVGTLVQIPVWWLFLRLGLSYWILPLVVVVVVAAWPAARRRVLSVDLDSTPLAWSASVAAICLVALGWLRGDFLRWSPPEPGLVHNYDNDLTFHLSVAAEAKHAMPPTVPQVAGEPLYYHWLAHADMAVASRMTGIELSTILFQLWVPVILLAGVVIVAACGSRISGHLWAGPLAALFIYGIGELVGAATSRPFAPLTQVYSWTSPSQTIAALFAIPAAGVIIDYLRRQVGSTRQLWLLGVPLFLALALAKSSELPVFMGGAGFVLVVALLRRDCALASRVLVAGLALTGSFVLSVMTVYGRQSGGIALSPLFVMRQQVAAHTDVQIDAFPSGATLIAVAVVTAIWVVAVLARAWGILLIIPRWRSADPGQILLAGALVSGIGAYLALFHPGGSQVFFMISAFTLGALASAWAICERAPRLTPKSFMVIGGLTIASGLTSYAVMDRLAKTPPDNGFGAQVLFLAIPALIVLAAVAVSASVVVVAHRRRRILHVSVSTVVTAAIVAGGIASTVQYTFSSLPDTSIAKARADITSYAAVTGKGVTAARWIRDHSDSDTIVATNRHCLSGQVFPGSGPVNACYVVSFWVSAWSERRVLVEGWAYSGKPVEEQLKNGRPYPTQPFWDQPLLAANDGFFEKPSAEGAAILCKRGATYALLDRRYQPDLPSLEPVAQQVFANSDVEVYRLPC